MPEFKFKIWNKTNKEWMKNQSCGQSLNYKTQKLEYTYSDVFSWQDWEVLREIGAFPADYERVLYTGLKDKNGKEGYFNSDIWEIKNYEYRVSWNCGFKVQVCDLRFILKEGLLETEYELIGSYEGLDYLGLKTIFNLPLESGSRIYVDNNRQNLEIIGTIHENPELLKKERN